MSYTPWRFNRLSEQQWWIAKDFFVAKMHMTETQAAEAADALGKYMDMVWQP